MVNHIHMAFCIPCSWFFLGFAIGFWRFEYVSILFVDYLAIGKTIHRCLHKTPAFRLALIGTDCLWIASNRAVINVLLVIYSHHVFPLGFGLRFWPKSGSNIRAPCTLRLYV